MLASRQRLPPADAPAPLSAQPAQRRQSTAKPTHQLPRGTQQTVSLRQRPSPCTAVEWLTANRQGRAPRPKHRASLTSMNDYTIIIDILYNNSCI